MHFREYAHHHLVGVLFFAFCAWVSISLIILLWLKHRSDPFFKRLFWSFVLCIPIFGWIAYGAFYTPLPPNTVRAVRNSSAFIGGL
jgi:bacteriorhodopsin